jgi:hypothetical protein
MKQRYLKFREFFINVMPLVKSYVRREALGNAMAEADVLAKLPPVLFSVFLGIPGCTGHFHFRAPSSK